MAPNFWTKLYDKRDDFNFLIVNFPFICSKIPAATAYGVYISQLIRHSRACGSYHTTQWSREKVQKDKERSIKHTYKTKDRVTQIPLKTGGELRCSGRVSSSCSTSDSRRVNLHVVTMAKRKSTKLFLLAIVLSVLLRYTDSDCPFGIFKLFLQWSTKHYIDLTTIK
jgi:hypothetical protein